MVSKGSYWTQLYTVRRQSWASSFHKCHVPSSMAIFTSRIDEAKHSPARNHPPCRAIPTSAESSELVSRLFLDQVEAHGDQSQPEDEVEGAQDHHTLGTQFVRGRPGHVVAKTDRRQSYEAKYRQMRVSQSSLSLNTSDPRAMYPIISKRLTYMGTLILLISTLTLNKARNLSFTESSGSERS